MKAMKVILTIIIGSIVSSNALSALPTKLGNINIDENDVFATIWAVVEKFLYYGGWLAICGSIIYGMFTIIGALPEARKKGDMSILWSSIGSTIVVIVIVIVLSILLVSYMEP